jgi:ferric-dicitrate binding protein FerR (iron transport regulator)
MEENNTYIDKVIDRADVASPVSALGEKLKDIVRQDIDRRIEAHHRRKLHLRWMAAAASIALLLGMTGYLSYQQGYKHTNSQWVQLTTPPGVQSSVVLPDGTKVKLNVETTLTYPTAFLSKNREVSVEGEAYFDVTHDAQHPFIVKTGNLNVRVLGTKFNLKAWKDEPLVQVTLEEGKVEAGFDAQPFHTLTPNQQLTFDKTLQTVVTHDVQAGYFTAWQEGKLYFNRMTMEQIARQLERQFNVHIYIESAPLKQTLFTGDFVRRENLEQILKVMAADKRIRYRIDGDKIHIY